MTRTTVRYGRFGALGGCGGPGGVGGGGCEAPQPTFGGCMPAHFKFGPHGPGGPHGPAPGAGGQGHGRGTWGRARRGNVRAAILAVLAEAPMHGYQIMQELDERSGGVWRPSPGSVYPTLQLLEDQGLVRGEEVEGRRVFSLTEAGRAQAEQSRERHGAPWESWGRGEQGPRYKLRWAVYQVGAAAKQVGAAGSAEQVEKTLEILADARRRVYALLAEGD
jgi:DNA-binding PadR family transcriptional regulator